MPENPTAERFRLHCATDRGAESLYLPGWSPADWAALLAPTRTVTLRRHEVLIEQGEAEHCLYFVSSGALDVNAGRGGSTMGTLFRQGPGSVIGEIAFFDGGGRSSRVWAVEPTELLALERADVERFASEHPTRGLELLFALGRVLAFRVRRSEQRLRVDAV